MIRVKHRLEDIGLALIVASLGVAGFRGAQKIGSFLATLWYRYYRRRVDVAKENIRRALGDAIPPGRLDELALLSFRNVGMTFMEFARFPYMSAADAARLVRFSNVEVIHRLHDEGKGALLVTGHLGNWELLGAAVASLGYPISFVVGRQGNTLVDRRINRYRARMGVQIIYHGAALREIPRALRRKEFVALLADQDAGRSGLFVDFLGTPASTPRGTAHFAYRCDVPIVFGATERLADGTHFARLSEPIYPDTTADERSEALRLTRAYTDLLAAEVRRRPEQYFWPHRRWKTKPVEGGRIHD